MLETIKQFFYENKDFKPQFLDLFYNLSFSLLQLSKTKFHHPNQQNLLKILRIASNRLLNSKYPNLKGNKKREITSNFITMCRKLFSSYFKGENFNRDDDILREFLFETVFEENAYRISQDLESASEEDKKLIRWVIRVITEQKNPVVDSSRNYQLEYFHLKNTFIGILNYNSNQQLDASFNNEIIKKTIYELENLWTPIERKNLKHLREQKFIFWDIGDFLVRYGIGFWSPYFTKKNNYRDREDININLIIPDKIIRRVQEIVGIYDGRISELESLPNDLDLFGEPTHGWIKDYLCENIFLFEDIINNDIINVQKEYNTNEIGKIDILLEDVNGTYWIVEIKPGEPNYSPIGQIMNYMSWVRENKRSQVKGILITKSISPQLRSAFRELNSTDIEICTYEVSEDQQITLNKVL
ncbi:MAG: endonuclease NucS domain-containing protein [Candidatus Lokiarchaeia archaeon]